MERSWQVPKANSSLFKFLSLKDTYRSLLSCSCVNVDFPKPPNKTRKNRRKNHRGVVARELGEGALSGTQKIRNPVSAPPKQWTKQLGDKEVEIIRVEDKNTHNFSTSLFCVCTRCYLNLLCV